jgi:uncharacterized transporter YbjL
MKVLFPRNVAKGMFNMRLSLGPLDVTIVQLFLLAIGVSIGLAVFNAVSKSGGRAAGLMAAIPVIGIFIVVAFFKVSEM